jgi:hypothetical protein
MEVEIIPVRYLGKKARQTDSVNGSGTVWNGNGDVQFVSRQHAARLFSHPLVWEDARENPKDTITPERVPAKNMADEEVVRPLFTNIAGLSRPALNEFALRQFGVYLDDDDDDAARDRVIRMVTQDTKFGD